MHNSKTQIINQNKYKILFIICLILIFTLPVTFYGIMDLEDYYFGFYSSYLIQENNFNPFLFFSDSIGPGISFPMGNGVFFHPLLLFVENVQLFYFLISVCHLSLQSFFFIKINKLLNVKKYVLFFVPLIIFSNTNFNYYYSDFWITGSSGFTFIFIITYYFLKILKKNNFVTYAKFSIFFFLFVENAHIGYVFFNTIFLIILFIFSKNKLLIIKDFKPYFFIVILLFLLLEKIYYYGIIFLNINSLKLVVSNSYVENPGLDEFISSFFPNSYFKSINRLPSNPFLTSIALFFILFFKKEKNLINLKYIFLVVVILNFTDILKVFEFILSAPWWIRDYTLIISCLVCLQYFGKIKKYLRIIIIILLFSYSLVFFGKNYFGASRSTNNFIVNKPNDYKMISFFDNLSLNKNFNRVYLSPEAYQLLDRNNSAIYGIYTARDLVKFNLSPFNIKFKNNVSTILFQQNKQSSYYYSDISQKIDDLENIFFLSLFNINYSFMSENEFNILDKENYIVMDKLNLPDKNFLLIKNKINMLGIKNPRELQKKIEECEYSILECLNLEKNQFIKINGNFIKKKNSIYKINIENDFEVYPILPFVFDKNWKCNNKQCLQIGNFLTYSENNGESIDIKYEDKIRFFLRVLSLITFLCLIFLIIFRKSIPKINWIS